MTFVTDTVTQQTIDVYAELSGDFNPLHVDPVAAVASEFGGVIAHGPIALHACFRALTEALAVEALPAGASLEVTYRAPTRPGDAITCAVEATSGAIETACVNQHGATVVAIRGQLPA
jgi:acyl dehydratase